MKISEMKPEIEVVDLEICYGPVAAVGPVSFTVRQGEQLTLLGPSGCGKTTTLRSLAGLERPSAGVIRVRGQTVYDGASGINVPAEKRGLSMVFQSYAIWPHMTVFDNVAYGLRVRDTPADEMREKVAQALDLVQMGKFAQRNASQLSGGQQQRIAVARAYAFAPKVILFDEPLSNLDAKLRSEMRIELRELQHRLGVTSVYVTHDLEEALAMSDQIIVMRGGHIEQIGSSNEIYNYPRTAFVADFVGSANLISGRLRPDLATEGLIAVQADGDHIVYGVAHGRQAEANPSLSVRTVHLQLSTERPALLRNVWPVTVRHAIFLGDLTQVHVDWGGRELVIRRTQAGIFSEGMTAWLSIDAGHCVLLESGEAITADRPTRMPMAVPSAALPVE